MLEEFPVEAPPAHLPKPPRAPLDGFVSEAELVTQPLVLDVVGNFSLADVEIRHSPVTPPHRSKTLTRGLITGALLGALAVTTLTWRIAGTQPSAPTRIEPEAERSVPFTQPTEVVESLPPAPPQKRPAQIAEVAAPITRMRAEPEPSRRETVPDTTRVSSPMDSAKPSVVMAAPSPVILEPLLEARQPAHVPAAVIEPAPAVVGRVENAPVASSSAAAVEREAIQNVLGQFRAAYADLDARAVKQVWPGASEAALAKAFANLESQDVAFYGCDTTITVATARAACEGQVSYVGRVGPRQPRTQNREWTFTLRKIEGDRWQIDRVQVR